MANFLISGIREILHEAIKSKLNTKGKIFRILFRFQNIRLLKRFIHDKKHKVNYKNIDLFNKGFQIVQTDLTPDIVNTLENLTFIEDGTQNEFKSLKEVLNYTGKRVHARYTSKDVHLKYPIIEHFAYNNPGFEVIKNYLGDNCKVQFSVCWISIPNVLEDSNFEFGFHMDISSWKWVNMFVYLNDVDELNGPHSCIENTHQKRHLSSFLERRLTLDRAIKKYGADRIVTFKGPRGTTILEDTGNYHRAMPIKEKYRFMLQLTY